MKIDQLVTELDLDHIDGFAGNNAILKRWRDEKIDLSFVCLHLRRRPRPSREPTGTSDRRDGRRSRLRYCLSQDRYWRICA